MLVIQGAMRTGWKHVKIVRHLMLSHIDAIISGRLPHVSLVVQEIKGVSRVIPASWLVLLSQTSMFAMNLLGSVNRKDLKIKAIQRMLAQQTVELRNKACWDTGEVFKSKIWKKENLIWASIEWHSQTSGFKSPIQVEITTHIFQVHPIYSSGHYLMMLLIMLKPLVPKFTVARMPTPCTWLDDLTVIKYRLLYKKQWVTILL